MSKVMLYKRYLELILKKQFVNQSDIGSSYTLASRNYEKVFLSTMHRYNDMLLDEVIKCREKCENTVIIDLACGTGYNTKYLKDKLKDSSFILCDLSKGMLNEARKINGEKIKIYENNMLSFLRKSKDKSADIIICTWAIKYQTPKKVIKECYRVLKKGGTLAVIVNKKSTLPEVRKILPKLFSKNVSKINKVMMPLPNPICSESFNRWFENAKFKVVKCSKGSHGFSFDESEKVVKFMVSTGALAGYDVMVDLRDEKVMDEIKEIVEEKRINTITHKFVWGIYNKI